MQSVSDDILMKAAHGDLKSFETVYAASAGFVYTVAYRVTGHKEDAEEVTQEVFVTLYRKLKDFRFQSSFKTWVYRIAVNTAINYVRKTSKERNKTVAYEENLDTVQNIQEQPVRMGEEEREQLVQSLLKRLNPGQRACIVLRNIEGLSYQEIAKALSININTVRSRLKRARTTLMSFKKEVNKNEL